MRSLSWMKGQFVRSAFCIALSLGLSAAITQSVSAQAPPSTPPGGTPGGGTPGTPVPPDQGGGNQGGGGDKKPGLKKSDFVVTRMWFYVDLDANVKQQAGNGDDPGKPEDFLIDATWSAYGACKIEPNSKSPEAKKMMAKGDYQVILRLKDVNGEEKGFTQVNGTVGKAFIYSSDKPTDGFEDKQKNVPAYPLRFEVALSDDGGELIVDEYLIESPLKYGFDQRDGSLTPYAQANVKGKTGIIGAKVIIGGKNGTAGTLSVERIRREGDELPKGDDKTKDQLWSYKKDAAFLSGLVCGELPEFFDRIEDGYTLKKSAELGRYVPVWALLKADDEVVKNSTDLPIKFPYSKSGS